jgi:hypothetical protein
VKTENPSACATMNCKLCKLAIAYVLIVIKGGGVTEVPINPNIRSRTRFLRQAYPPTHDSIVTC